MTPKEMLRLSIDLVTDVHLYALSFSSRNYHGSARTPSPEALCTKPHKYTEPLLISDTPHEPLLPVARFVDDLGHQSSGQQPWLLAL